MTASNHPGLTHAKPVKREKARKRVRRITAKQRKISKSEQPENAKVVERSGGRCEVVERWTSPDTDAFYASRHPVHCYRPATELHHLLGGWRRRGRNDSRLAIHKLAVCTQCHHDITEHKLQRLGGPVPLWTDCYQRTR